MNGMTGLQGILARIGISGLAIALLALLLAVQTIRIEGFKIWPISVDGLKKERDDARDKAAKCEERHKITKASVGRLEDVIEELNAAALLRAEQYAEAWATWEAESKRLKRDKAKSDKKVATLREMASRTYEGRCEVPDDMREALEGL